MQYQEVQESLSHSASVRLSTDGDRRLHAVARAVTTESDVAEAVWRAANDTSGQMRFPAGPDAVALAEATA